MLISTLSDAVTLAMIASFTTLAGQIITLISRRRERKTDAARAKLIEQKVDSHSEDLKQELAKNTEVTITAANSAEAAAGKADAAFNEANNFNARFMDLKRSVEAELQRLSANVHTIANAVTPMLAKELDWQKRKPPGI